MDNNTKQQQNSGSTNASTVFPPYQASEKVTFYDKVMATLDDVMKSDRSQRRRIRTNVINYHQMVREKGGYAYYDYFYYAALVESDTSSVINDASKKKFFFFLKAMLTGDLDEATFIKYSPSITAAYEKWKKAGKKRSDLVHYLNRLFITDSLLSSKIATQYTLVLAAYDKAKQTTIDPNPNSGAEEGGSNSNAKQTLEDILGLDGSKPDSKEIDSLAAEVDRILKGEQFAKSSTPNVYKAGSGSSTGVNNVVSRSAEVDALLQALDD